MFKLLSLEYKKFKDNAVVRLFGLMFLITFPTIIFMLKEFNNAPKAVFDIDTVYQFPKIWDYMGYTASWLIFFFLGFIVLTTITSEVTYKTMRQNIISGMTRKDFFKSKLLMIVSFSLITTVLYTLICMIIAAVHMETWTFAEAMDNGYAIPKCFLMCMGYLSFAMMIAFIIRRSGIAIFTYVCYIIFIETMLKWGSNYFHSSNLINYWPLNTIEDLFPNPMYRNLENVPMKGLEIDFLLSNSHSIIFSCIYILLFIGIAYRSFMTRDI